MAQVPLRLKGSYRIRGVYLDKKSLFSFSRKSDGLTIRLAFPEEKGVDVRADIEKTFSVSEKKLKSIRFLESGKLPEGSKPQRVDGRIRKDGTFDVGTKFLITEMPGSLQDLYWDVRREFSEAIQKMWRLLRWRSKSAWLPTFYGEPDVFWEGADGKYQEYPYHFPPPGEVQAFLQVEGAPGWDAYIGNHLDGEMDEPIGHQLLKNAQEMRNGDPRACISLAVAAVEIAVKHFIGSKVPGAQWLALNMPTPPMKQIVMEYIPLLCPEVSFEELSKVFPEKLMADFEKFIKLRNAIVHRGSAANNENAKECCKCMQTILWRLDYLMGEKWAFREDVDNKYYDSRMVYLDYSAPLSG